METYNGWKNRSTWLLALHLSNTPEAYKIAIEKASQSTDTKMFKELIKPVMRDIRLLWEEEGFNALEIDFTSVWNSLLE